MLQCEKQLHAFEDDKLQSYFFCKNTNNFFKQKKYSTFACPSLKIFFREIDLSSFKQERRMIQQIFLRRIENIEDTS